MWAHIGSACYYNYAPCGPAFFCDCWRFLLGQFPPFFRTVRAGIFRPVAMIIIKKGCRRLKRAASPLKTSWDVLVSIEFLPHFVAVAVQGLQRLRVPRIPPYAFLEYPPVCSSNTPLIVPRSPPLFFMGAYLVLKVLCL